MHLTLFTYRATVKRVVDGDTLVLACDLGMRIFTELEVRLQGVNCPEKKSPGFNDAKLFAEAWVEAHDGKVIVQTMKDKKEKYGRLLARVFGPSGDTTLNQALLDNDLAVPYLE